jgi:hypothetical protein
MLELKSNIRSEFSKIFLEEIFSGRTQYYMFFGNNPEINTNFFENLDTLENENNAKKSMLFAYQINPRDCSFAIKRNDWEQNKKYQEYSDLLDQSRDNNFYVTKLDEGKHRVYKCIKNGNNNPLGSVSPPYGTLTEDILIESDGYVWKFMYEVPEELEKFITDSFYPVPIVENITYSDERSLQVNVQTNAIDGTIKNISIIPFSESINTINDNDIINSEFLNNSCEILSVGTNSNGNLLVTVRTTTQDSLQNPIFLSDENDYYNQKYFMIIQGNQEGETVASVKTYTVINNNTLAIFELCEITGDASNIVVGSKYSIVPKIEIRGDGQDAIAIPRFVDLNLIGIDLISEGSNFTKANARFLIDMPFTLVPIISPRKGHGFSAYEELGAKSIIINKNIELHTNKNIENTKYFFGNNYEINQFGIIKDLETKNGNKFDIFIQPKVNLTLFSENATTTIVLTQYEEPTDLFFSIGDIISRGPAFKKDQFKGKIISLEMTTNGFEITCELLNGMFDNYPSYLIYNETTKQSLIYSTTDGIFSSSFGVFTSDIINQPKFILGKESLFSGEIESVIPNIENTNFLSLKLNRLNGIPRKSTYSSSGEILSGESVILIEEDTNNQEKIIQEAGNLKVFSYDFDLISFSDFNYSYLVNLNLVADSQIEEEISELNIFEGNYIGKYIISSNKENFGKIIAVEYLNPQIDGGYSNANFYIKIEKGTFTNLQTPKLYITETSPYSFDIFETILTDIGANLIQNPIYYEDVENMNINSGKVLYLENIDSVSLLDDQSINVNIVLTF